MPEISYHQLDTYLRKVPADRSTSLFLIFGEEYLVQLALTAVTAKLIGSASHDLNIESIDGQVASIADALEKVRTFSLLAGPKVVAYTRARLFDTGGSAAGMVKQIQKAGRGAQRAKAARLLAGLCAMLDVGLDMAVADPADCAGLAPVVETLGEEKVKALAQYGLDHKIKAAGTKGQAEALIRALEDGFAPGQHLLITTDAVDKRRVVYKNIKSAGTVIDCSVPTGDRKVDQQAQTTLMRQMAQAVLTPAGKKLQAAAFQQLYRLTGVHLRAFRQNLEKLVDYTGSRPEITTDDVAAVLQRTRPDPIYALTNALADRDAVACLRVIDHLLADGFYPLQLLAAMANQVRRLLLAKDFTGSAFGGKWHAGMHYNQFASQVMADVVAFDADLARTRQAMLTSGDTPGKAADRRTKAGKKSKAPGSDLVLARNPKSPYPVFQTLLKASGFSLEELIRALEAIKAADRLLKSSGQAPRLVIEKTVMAICRSTNPAVA